MSFLRAIRDDLVEKRLWPVALALVLALIAVPVLLGRSSAAPAGPPLPDPTVTAPPVKDTAQALVLAGDAPRRPVGRPKDPFARTIKVPKQEPAPVPVIGATTVTPADAATPPAIPPVVSPGAGTSNPPTGITLTPGATITTPTSPAPAGTPDPYAPHPAGYRVDVDWGPVAASKSQRDVIRLGTLDAGADPAVVFMGVRPDGKTALFLLASDTTTGTGDARCRPTEDLCSLLELRAGDTEFLDVVTPSGVRQYELHVDRVAEKREQTAAEARKRLARHSKAGARLVSGVIDAGRTFVRRYVYTPSTGVLKFAVDAAARATRRGVLVNAE